ncbi:hypothetical protein D9M68_448670 [compost metagenome]
MPTNSARSRPCKAASCAASRAWSTWARARSSCATWRAGPPSSKARRSTTPSASPARSGSRTRGVSRWVWSRPSCRGTFRSPSRCGRWRPRSRPAAPWCSSPPKKRRSPRCGWPSWRWRRAFRRARSTWCAGAAPRPARRWRRTPTSARSASPARRPWAVTSATRPSTAWRASRSSWAASRRSSCSATPTRWRRRRARPTASSFTRARCARPARACTCSAACSTRWCAGSRRRPRACTSVRASTRRRSSGRWCPSATWRA